MSIGDQIRDARNHLGWSQDTLGDKIHMSRQTVSHWETGRKSVPIEYISTLEEVLQCKFDIEQEPVETAEDQVSEASAPRKMQTAEARKRSLPTFLQKSIPAWLCVTIAGGIFVVMLIIMLCTTSDLQRQIVALEKSSVPPYSLAWYQQRDVEEEGQAFITITTDSNPVKAVPDPDGGEQNIWRYTISMIEHNGISFTVNEIALQPFNGNVPMKTIVEYAEKIASEWGENMIPANGMQCWHTGMPVQAISHMGILVKGIDAKGNALEFRSIVEFSHELAE